ncbi:MAG: Propionyl-CoA carboxylase beta chain [uncultured Pseudonocardia sp.]|uniref:Propionyl-CoA carboxylase beta chain n=1 Tax=uncultured Pseudonocardia sp. TaxID=211455 RepID=A0A6J4Q432_9PSEU|nr:MAG: Propionyl-CoA carboxylase beta chain [uncultured Pseudonocardia sp.]
MNAGAPVTDPRDPVARLLALVDGGSLVLADDPHGCGVRIGCGRIGPVAVTAFCTDARAKAGALGATAGHRIAEAIDDAVDAGRPVVGLWQSGGARLDQGVSSLHGAGSMFRSMTLASGRVPQVSVVLGPSAGAAAYGPALTDLVVLAEEGRIFVTGPDVVEAVTGERVDMAQLGGGAVHGRRSGVAHQLAADEGDAMTQARTLVDLLARTGRTDPAAAACGPDCRSLLPDSPRRAYDVRPLVRAVLDGQDLQEVQAAWAPNVLTGLGRLGGGTVGVVASNPISKGGCLDSTSAEKAARFVRMCDALGIPLVVVVDVPGYLPGVDEEWGGVVRRGAKLLHAFAAATVPRVTLITRKAFGGAYIAMNSRSLGASAVLAWPDAEIAVMGPEAAVEILHRGELAAAAGPADRERLSRELAERQRRRGGTAGAVEIGVVDDVIDPALTRPALALALAAAPRGRGRHTNIPL